jgi:ABC-type nitrate/sulfonate/bicarbonate transport system permease component
MNKAERWLSILSPVLLLLLWEALVRSHILDARYFPAPSAVFQALGELASSGELWLHVRVSLVRIALGFVIGAVPGISLGIAMGLNRWVRAILNPLVAATYPIPKTAILPLIMLVFGLGEASKVALVAISVFFVLLINAMAGVQQIDPIYLDVGRNFRVSRLQFFRTIALPGALPFIMAGVKLGIGVSLIVIVVAEMVASRSGIGYLIWQSWTTLAVEQMYVGLVVISGLGLITSYGLDELERVVVPWKRQR